MEGYTRESGVRNLDKKVAKLIRSTAKDVAMGNEAVPSISKEQLEKILGPSASVISMRVMHMPV